MAVVIRDITASLLRTFPCNVIGAGDSFDAGFISAYVSGKDPEFCQFMGNLAGAVNTTAAGGTGAFKSKEAFIETARKVFGQTL